MAKRLGPVRVPVLSFLALLPSAWVPLVELSRIAARDGKREATEFARRAINAHRGVLPPYEQYVRAWKKVNDREEPALVVVLAIMPNRLRDSATDNLGLKQLEQSPIETQVELSDEEVALVLKEIFEVGGKFTRKGVRFVCSGYGTGWIDTNPSLSDGVDQDIAIEIFNGMRTHGQVTRPYEFLSAFPRSQEVESALLGAEQDLKALRGVISIDIPAGRRYRPKPMSSLYLLHNSLPEKSGGYSTRSHGLLTGLRSHGVEAIPVTRPGFPAIRHVFDQDPATPPLHVVDGIPYHRLVGPVPNQPRSDLQGFVELYTEMLEPLVDQHRPSVIHAASNWWNGFAGVAAAKRHSVPSVYEIRGLWELTRASRQAEWYQSERYQADANYETAAANLADRVIVITEGLRREMVERGVPNDKITVVPNAVNLGEFQRATKDAALAQRLELEEACVIGFAGSLTFYEGLDDLLRAGASILGKTNSPFRFLIVGDGPVLDELKDLAIELGISDLCRFPGRVPHSEVAKYLSLMDITPFPRIPIPVCEIVSPLKPLESMAMGVAVLASDVQALKEMVPPGTGITFSKGDSSSLAERLQLLIDNPDMRQELTSNAYEWVAKNRNWNHVSKKIKDIYQELGV